MRPLVLTGTQARKAACEAVMGAPAGYVVRIAEPKRSGEQNDLLHAELQEISERMKWAGEALNVEDWKRLMTAGWMKATGRNIRLVPAIEGPGFDVLYQRTSTLGKSEMTELIEYIKAWKADRAEFA